MHNVPASVALDVRRAEAAEQREQEVETAGLYICKFYYDSRFTNSRLAWPVLAYKSYHLPELQEVLSSADAERCVQRRSASFVHRVVVAKPALALRVVEGVVLVAKRVRAAVAPKLSRAEVAQQKKQNAVAPELRRAEIAAEVMQDAERNVVGAVAPELHSAEVDEVMQAAERSVDAQIKQAPERTNLKIMQLTIQNL